VVSIEPALFRDQMSWLASSGISVVSLEQARHTPMSIALTFDDGFRNFMEHALPSLEAHRFPCTVFIVSGRCGLTNYWPGQSPKVPELDLMSWTELADTAALGVTLGSHSVSHANLATMSPTNVQQEMRRSRMEMEDRLGRPVEVFAYPGGWSTPEVRDCARRHYRLACGTRLGYTNSSSDRFDLPRIDMYYFRNRFLHPHLMSTAGRGYLAMRKLFREIRPAFL